MLKNTLINRKVIQTIARALGEMNDEVIYVGGAVVSLYIDDKAADDVRPTKDLDISLVIASLSELENTRLKLIEKGFTQTFEDSVMCRFRYNDIKVDVMATKTIGWAPGSPWFEAGFVKAETVAVDDINIKILPPPYYLASKFEAFRDRGKQDPLTSKDFEDIVYLLNHTSGLKDAVMNVKDKPLRAFLKTSFAEVLNSKQLQEVLRGNLFYEEQTIRFENIMTDLQQIIDGL